MARKPRNTTPQRSSPEQAAAELGMSVRTLARHVKAGALTLVRERGLTYFTREEIERFVRAKAA
jgi:hypothetical protein